MQALNYLQIFLGIIVGLIGVFTFILSLINGAKKDGAMLNKIDTVLGSVEEIKNSLKNFEKQQTEQEKESARHDEKIDTLFNMTEELKERVGEVEQRVFRKCE